MKDPNITLKDPKDILKKYWGFDEFRPNQLEIINEIINKNDVLALLPTGGGKSICYQVPALMLDGICIVVSPLIALMQDQVQNLNSKGIKAIAITSGMGTRQIDRLLDNCIYGGYKFLYVSPERLKSHLFLSRFEKMNVSFIAVDEAHCISEWGFDFRPSYRDIADLNTIKKDLSISAFTATATSEVVEDIQDKLEFKKPNLISSSFFRPNLTYDVIECDNKLNRIEEQLLSTKSSSIVYCSTRKEVKSVCQHLINKGIDASFYHGGLDYTNRKERQQKWMKSDSSVIVCTNAFGMGIDKGNVSLVLHYSIPETLEAYFQEAGRAGRDGNEAKGILYYEKADIQRLREKVELKFPQISQIKKVYNALGNYFQLAIGSGLDESYPIDIMEFCDRFSFDLIETFNALKFLELSGFIVVSENFQIPSKIQITADKTTLYNYQVKSEEVNKIVQFIIRTQMGVFDNLTIINEKKVSKELKISFKKIIETLKSLHELDIINYQPSLNGTHIYYKTERLNEQNLSLPAELYHRRKKLSQLKLSQNIDFLKSEVCTSKMLLNYFNQSEAGDCNKCKRCLSKSKTQSTNAKDVIRAYVNNQFTNTDQILITDLIAFFSQYERENVLDVIRWLSDHNDVHVDALGKKLTRP